MCEILVIDNNETDQLYFESVLLKEGHKVVIVDNWSDAKKLLTTNRFTMVILDFFTPGLNRNCIEIFTKIKSLNPNTLLIVTAKKNQLIPDVVFNEAHDFIPKPINSDTLIQITKRSIERRSKKELEDRYMHSDIGSFTFQPIINDMINHHKQIKKDLSISINRLRQGVQTLNI